ncbi:hypothetical protein VNO77_03690 [Canavalia gladiata]|uniref:Uncharacterized protein n=1 Tax=Canavalia gladiata TaxID=3824 RepID=A0AAN9MVB4_CANGL
MLYKKRGRGSLLEIGEKRKKGALSFPRLKPKENEPYLEEEEREPSGIWQEPDCMEKPGKIFYVQRITPLYRSMRMSSLFNAWRSEDRILLAAIHFEIANSGQLCGFNRFGPYWSQPKAWLKWSSPLILSEASQQDQNFHILLSILTRIMVKGFDQVVLFNARRPDLKTQTCLEIKMHRMTSELAVMQSYLTSFDKANSVTEAHIIEQKYFQNKNK